MEASALSRATRGGLLARRSPLLRFEADERLIALIRAGHDGAFEVLFNRYHSRLLGFCQSMLKSRQDAEDVLQEVFANAHAAMLGDERAINVRPWLYRIARNRCLNHLRKPVPEGQDSMDIHPHQNGTTTAEQVQSREDLRMLLADVRTLPETQRTALLLREIDQLSYEEIAQAMDTTVPAIKSLLVRARIALAESSQARLLTCEEVQVELAEAAEGLGKATGPARKHVRDCDGCRDFRNQLRSDRKALAALFPLGPLALIKGGVLSKLFGGGSAAGTGAGAAGTGAVGAGAGAGAVGGASAAGGISGGLGLLGGALGTKAAAGVATAALLTAGAVEVRNISTSGEESAAPAATQSAPALAEDPASDVGHAASPHFVANSAKAVAADVEPAPAPAEPAAPRDAAPVAEEPAAPAEPVAEKETPAPAAETEPSETTGEVAIGSEPEATPGPDPETGATPTETVDPVPVPTTPASEPAPTDPATPTEVVPVETAPTPAPATPAP